MGFRTKMANQRKQKEQNKDEPGRLAWGFKECTLVLFYATMTCALIMNGCM